MAVPVVPAMSPFCLWRDLALLISVWFFQSRVSEKHLWIIYLQFSFSWGVSGQVSYPLGYVMRLIHQTMQTSVTAVQIQPRFGWACHQSQGIWPPSLKIYFLQQAFKRQYH